MFRCLAMTMVLIQIPLSLCAGEYHAAPTGKAGGDGSAARPWDVQTSLAGAPDARGALRVRAGDVVWLAEGTYAGPYRCTAAGRQGAPVTYRAVPGRRATLDCRVPAGRNDAPDFYVDANHVVLWGLELTCSDTQRRTAIKGSWPEDIRRGGFTCRASNVKFINCVVHDAAGGFGFWSGGEGGEIYGCLVYNNGWVGPDRGHGHAIYAQNRTGAKSLVDNILFNQFSHGIHCYGSEKAFLNGFHVEGNVSFNNGSGADANGRAPAILIGGGCKAEGIAVVNNCTYGDEHGGGGVSLGYDWGLKHNGDVVVRGNTIVGGLRVLYWDRGSVEDNTVIASSGLVHLVVPKGGTAAGCTWRRNTYLRTGSQWEAFAVGADGGKVEAREFAEWQKQVRDTDSTFTHAAPKGVKVFVRPNKYEPGRGHAIVYNWDRRSTVEADLSKVLKMGQKFRVVSAQDYYGDAVAAGTYDGKAVSIPMREYRAAPPIGMPDHKPPTTGPTFNAFVVLGE